MRNSTDTAGLNRKLLLSLKAISCTATRSNSFKTLFSDVYKRQVFDAPGLFPYTSLPHTSLLVNLFKEEKPQICLMGATVIGRDLGPRVSSALTSGLKC